MGIVSFQVKTRINLCSDPKYFSLIRSAAKRSIDVFVLKCEDQTDKERTVKMEDFIEKKELYNSLRNKQMYHVSSWFENQLMKMYPFYQIQLTHGIRVTVMFFSIRLVIN